MEKEELRGRKPRKQERQRRNQDHIDQEESKVSHSEKMYRQVLRSTLREGKATSSQQRKPKPGRKTGNQTWHPCLQDGKKGSREDKTGTCGSSIGEEGK